jgi:ATP-binding cassette subfamily B (MDR/TAP) protein 10
VHGQVGELTGILSQDLGAIKDLINENVSRDRGFRAFSEVSHFSLVCLSAVIC